LVIEVPKMRTIRALGLTVFLLVGCKQDAPKLGPEFAVYTPGERIDVTVNGIYAASEGVWTIEGDDKINSPINSSRIWCEKASGICQDNRSYFARIGDRWYLYSTVDLYDVKTWEDETVIATAFSDCRAIELKVSQRDKSVTSLTTADPVCKNILQPILEKPRLAFLISGKQLDDQRGVKP